MCLEQVQKFLADKLVLAERLKCDLEPLIAVCDSSVLPDRPASMEEI